MRSFLESVVFGVSLFVVAACDGGGSGGSGGNGGQTGVGASPQTGGTGNSGAAGSTGQTTGTNTDTPTTVSCDPNPDVAGKVTYYNEADGSGACSFDPTPNDLMVAAMNAPQYADSAACGACAELETSDGKSVTVRIVDLCPGCEEGHVDLSPQAFEKLGPLSAGVLSVTWRYVSCPVIGPIQYKFKEGSNQWWSAVQVRNATERIAKFEVEKDGAMIEVGRTSYNYFVDDQGMGPGPYHFRVTDVRGNVLEDEGISFIEGGIVEGKAQFPLCN
ncbi:MAG: hypothetical protein IPK82_13285 [Polyangiaceae bacterium]|nr:hypothetical protein [Polyangiaceae bacterium]